MADNNSRFLYLDLRWELRKVPIGIDLNLEKSTLSSTSGLVESGVSSKLNISSNNIWSSTSSSFGIASNKEVEDGFGFKRFSIWLKDIFGRENNPCG